MTMNIVTAIAYGIITNIYNPVDHPISKHTRQLEHVTVKASV